MHLILASFEECIKKGEKNNKGGKKKRIHLILQQDCLILPVFIFPFLSASPLSAHVRVIVAFSQIFGCKYQNEVVRGTHTQAVPTSEGFFLG